MREYLLTIIITSVAFGFYDILVPKHNGTEKLVRYISMLIILGAVVSPISVFLKNINEGALNSIKEELSAPKNDYEDDYNLILQEYLNNYSISLVEEKIKELLEKNYSIPFEDCEVRIFTNEIEGNVSIDKIQILLWGESIFKNPYQIEAYIGEYFKCTCQVLIKSKE